MNSKWYILYQKYSILLRLIFLFTEILLVLEKIRILMIL